MQRHSDIGALRAGAARVDITPWADVQVAGDVGSRRAAQYVLDPLYGRVIVLDDGATRLCFVSADLTIIDKHNADQIRQHAAKTLGCSTENVMVHVTQTHTAPGLGQFMLDPEFAAIPAEHWLRGSDAAYDRFAVEKINHAIDGAAAQLQPVQLAVGRAVEGRLAFNRRAVRKDGKVFMPGPRLPGPAGWPELVHMEGPIDPELAVWAFRTPALRTLSMLLHYTCHPVNVFPKPIVSADWCGVWCDQMQEALNVTTPMVVNGCCGNINPWDPFDPAYEPDHMRMGAQLASTSQRLLETMRYEPIGANALRAASRVVRLPIREIEGYQLARAREILAEHPEIKWADASCTRADGNWFWAATTVSLDLLRQRERELAYEVQVFRVGDYALVGLPGEPFVEGQLRLKKASPARHTLVAHMVNQYVGYLPTREAFPAGGHEVNTSTWAKLDPDALDAVVDAAVELLRQVF